MFHDRSDHWFTDWLEWGYLTAPVSYYLSILSCRSSQTSRLTHQQPQHLAPTAALVNDIVWEIARGFQTFSQILSSAQVADIVLLILVSVPYQFLWRSRTWAIYPPCASLISPSSPQYFAKSKKLTQSKQKKELLSLHQRNIPGHGMPPMIPS